MFTVYAEGVAIKAYTNRSQALAYAHFARGFLTNVTIETPEHAKMFAELSR